MHDPYFRELEIPKPADLGGGPWKLVGLTAITTLFGKNGSGKSRLLRTWRDLDNVRAHYIIPEQIGQMTFEAGYLADETDGARRSNSGRFNFIDSYRQRVITRIQAYFMARGSTRGDQLPGDPGELESLFLTTLPDFEISLRGATPPYELKRRSNNEIVGDVNQLSSGEAQIASVALDILTVAAIWDMQHASPRLLLIDEPDAHIHPDLQVRFADFLVQVAERFKLQVVVATHSTTLLAALGQFGAEFASVIYLDRTKSSFVAKPFSKEIKELSACLGGHALMGPLFGVPLLLVEGDDDYRIWSQVPRYHVTSFTVIPTNGDEIKQYQRSLETIFSALRENKNPAGFALLDGDKALPVANADATQNHIRFIKLACHEAENLFLTDEVLALLDTDWKTASVVLRDNSGKFGNKAAELAAATTWDRRTVDIHGLMEEITKTLDPKNVHWTLRVARAIGANRPVGQLHDFLGEQVVTALWGAPERLQAAAE